LAERGLRKRRRAATAVAAAERTEQTRTSAIEDEGLGAPGGSVNWKARFIAAPMSRPVKA